MSSREALRYTETPRRPRMVIQSSGDRGLFSHHRDRCLWICQRPLQRILSVKQVEIILLIAINLHEANEPFSLIRQSKYVLLHIYTPRVAKAMATLEDPTFFLHSTSPKYMETGHDGYRPVYCNLFSGQLYLKHFDTYLRLLLILGLVGEEAKEERTHGGPGGKAAVSSNWQTVMVRYNPFASQLRSHCVS